MLTRYLRQLPFIGLKTGLPHGGLHMYRQTGCTYTYTASTLAVCVYVPERVETDYVYFLIVLGS